MLGAFVPQELPLPNGGFDRGLQGWTVTAPAKSVKHDVAPETRERCAKVKIGGGASASLHVDLEIGNSGDVIEWLPQSGDPGERPRF